MMKKLMLLMIFCLSSVVASALSLKNIVVFGDSLSDNGNLYEYMQHQFPMSPPYFEGHFSNGPVWVEQLMHSYFPDTSTQHLLNYAFGGAGVSEDPNSDMLFTLKHEIDSYLLSHQDKADPQSLFVVWMGANNYLTLPDQPDQTVNEVIAGTQRSLQRLVNAGAKHILVFNLPDLGQSPFAKMIQSQEQLSAYSTLHNSKLQDAFKQLQWMNSSVQWLYFDVNAMLDSVLMHPDQYGFLNIDMTCVDNMSLVNNHSSAKYTMINVASQASFHSQQDHCQGYLFFDPIHPTTLAHELMAKNVHRLLDGAGIEFL